MADEQQANTTVETDTQPEPVPSSEEQTPPSVEGAEAEPGRAVSKEPETDKEGLPEEVSDRTRREFDKLRKQLREERTKRLETEGAFNAMRPRTQPAAPANPDWMIDPESGTVDVNKLGQAWTNLEQRAARAEQSVNRYIEDTQKREAFKSHPELDSTSDNFDEDLHKRTRAFLFDSMMNPNDYQNKTLTYKEAADLAKGSLGKATEKAKAEGAKEAKEQLTPKEQASLEATGRSDKRNITSANLKDLEVRSRQAGRAGTDAIAERLKRSNL